MRRNMTGGARGVAGLIPTWAGRSKTAPYRAAGAAAEDSRTGASTLNDRVGGDRRAAGGERLLRFVPERDVLGHIVRRGEEFGDQFAPGKCLEFGYGHLGHRRTRGVGGGLDFRLGLDHEFPMRRGNVEVV